MDGEIDFWSTVVARKGDTEPQRAFTYAVGTEVAGSSAVATKSDTNLEVQGRLPVLPFRIDRFGITIPKKTSRAYTGSRMSYVTPSDVRNVALSGSFDLYRISVRDCSADLLLSLPPAPVRPWDALKHMDSVYYREVALNPGVVVGFDHLIWVRARFDKPLELTSDGLLLKFTVSGRRTASMGEVAGKGG